LNSGSPMVSLVVCGKNCEDTLPNCLESIKNLSYKNFELIFVDGKSVDRSVEIAERFGALVVSDRGNGLGYARRIGVEKSSEEFIGFIDSDMVTKPEWIQVLLSALKDPAVAGVEDSQECGNPDSLPARLEFYAWRLFWKRRSKFQFQISIGTANSMWKRSALIKVGNFDPAFRYTSEDVDISYRLRRAGFKLVKVYDPLSYHFWRATWKDLWSQYFWYGYGARQLREKHKDLKFPWRIWLVMPYSCVKMSLQACFYFHDLAGVALGLHYFYKMISWLLGYLRRKIS